MALDSGNNARVIRQPSWQLASQILLEPWRWKAQQVEAAYTLATGEGFRLIEHHQDDGARYWTLEDARAGTDSTYTYAPSLLDPYGDPPCPTPKNQEILASWAARESSRLETNGESIVDSRVGTHGDHNDQVTMCSKLWSSYLGIAVSPHDVAVLNALQKISRIRNGDATHADHWDDICGWSVIGRDLSGKGSAQ